MIAACLLAAAAATAARIGCRDFRRAQVAPAECALLCVLAAAAAAAEGGGQLPRQAGGAAAALLAVALACAVWGAGALPRGDRIALAALGWAAGWPEAGWMLAAGAWLSLPCGLWRRRRAFRRRGLRGLWRTPIPLLPGFAWTTAGILAMPLVNAVLDALPGEAK